MSEHPPTVSLSPYTAPQDRLRMHTFEDIKIIYLTYPYTPCIVCSIAAVESVKRSGRICILDIDVQGVQKVKESSLDPRYIFVAPPSFEELEQRLRGRGTETEEAVQVRLGNAAAELEYGSSPGNFDRVFVNNDLEACFAEVVAVLQQWYPQLKATE